MPRVTLALEIAVEPIASHIDVFRLLRAKRALSLQHTIFHVQLCHTQLFTYNLFYFSILHHLLCLSFLPRPRYNICCSYWKKLTCGVIRSFNFLPALQCHLLMRLPRMRLPCETKVDVTKCHACQSCRGVTGD